MTLEPQEDWRRRAEAQVAGAAWPELGELETRRVVHELRVHQLELEMQNQALHEARQEAEAGWERYQDFFDFSPAGYFSVDRLGLILEANLAGARLLGLDRGALAARTFTSFLREADRPSFLAFLARGLEGAEVPPCEVAAGDAWLRLQVASSADGRVLQMVALDITDQVRTREGLERALAGLQALCIRLAGEFAGHLGALEGSLRTLREAGQGRGPNDK